MQVFSCFPFTAFCQKVLPAVYDDSLTYYEQVCKLIAKVNEIVKKLETHDAQIEELQQAIQNLYDYVHGLPFEDQVKQAVEQWVDQNLTFIFEQVVDQVFFGLTSDGYFCAYVPASWSDITFDTGMVYGTEQYGRLILRYDVDGQGVIDNTDPYYPVNNINDQINDLTAKVAQLRHTVYTALTTKG